MNDITNFETFLFVGDKKLIISVKQENSQIFLYQKEFILENKFDKLDLELIDNFLNDHIFKIEKLIKDFVKNIYLIIDIKDLFKIQISVKKNNYGDLINLESLNHPLNEIKDQCKKTLRNEKIIHMLIDNYRIDEKNFKFLPENLNCNYFSLDVTFICFPDEKIEKLETIFKKYHISIKKIISAKYVREFLKEENMDIFDKSLKIINGFNVNEVNFVEKSTRNKGFFEKFFDFFN